MNNRVPALIAGCIGLTLAAPARSQDVAPPSSKPCELHIWPTDNYGGVFFHTGGIQFNGYGTSLELVSTPVERAAQKARLGFGPDAQGKALVDSNNRSGKFANYAIVVHDPLPRESAMYIDVKGRPVGVAGRKSASTAPCYAEIHVISITAFRTNLTKMLMTAFLVRYFPADPAKEPDRVIGSRLERGEERIGFSPFDFATPEITPAETDALRQAFTFMSDRFLRKKVS
jgi:hypothetical protein